MKNLLKRILLQLIALYQYMISPLLGPTCRFLPTCSEYAKQAIAKYGAIKGIFLTFKRLIKCHPWHKGGIDELD